MPPETELVVVDGASPDMTPAVMASYLSRYPNIRYYRESENSGVDRDYDKAIEYAKGEYCWLMTDDDLLASDAIDRIMIELDGLNELVVVDSEIRSADFSTLLRPSLFERTAGKKYEHGDKDAVFGELGNGLSFIGSVVIKREIWLSRQRTQYYGSLFIHVGVIFQNPPIERVTLIAGPLLVIRYGNSMWAPRAFEVSMFLWPDLIWSFSGFTDRMKRLICPRAPWRNIKQLLFLRAVGSYTWTGYRKFVLGRARGSERMVPLAIAVLPVWLCNSALSLIYAVVRRKSRTQLYALARSPHASSLAHLAARSVGIV
jgi:glycosyltransferase involved in cell wall biosynthesis